MSTGSVSSVGQSSQATSSGNSVFRDVGMDDFLKLLIAELQNQDPMEPMDNAAMLEQIGQIRSIESNERMTETLEAVQLGQNMGTASNLIGRTVAAMTADGTRVSGRVDRVSIQDGLPKLEIGGQVVELKNLEAIVADADNLTSDETAES